MCASRHHQRPLDRTLLSAWLLQDPSSVVDAFVAIGKRCLDLMVCNSTAVLRWLNGLCNIRIAKHYFHIVELVILVSYHSQNFSFLVF